MKLLFLLILIFILNACTKPEDEFKQGQKLFHSVHIGKNNVIGCVSCHSLRLDVSSVGPSLYAIGLRADKMVQGLSAKAYLKQSIINPDAYIVNGYTPAIMFAHYQDELSNEQIKQLVVYLLTLR